MSGCWARRRCVGERPSRFWDRRTRLAGLLYAVATAGETSNDRQFLENINQRLAELELLEGRPEAAVARMEPFAAGSSEGSSLIGLTLARAYLERGDVEAAHALIER